MRIREEIFKIPGANLGGTSPLPKFRSRKPASPKFLGEVPEELIKTAGYQSRPLPYLMQDRYNHTWTELSLKSFVLENDYLEARFLPEFGGRLHSLYDKREKRDLLFANPVIQPGNLATRDAWLSGGIEWNIGQFGHTYTTCDNVFAAVLDDGEGNDFLRIYEFERNKSIFWQIDFHLPDDSPRLISHVRMINPFPKNTSTYWWTNIAVPSNEKTRVLASNKEVVSFVRGKCKCETLPNLEALPGLDVSYPNDSAGAYDYFIQSKCNGESTWEAAAYEGGKVFYERSTAPLYYKKLFCWGNHPAGLHWQEFLSAGKGHGYYVELQAGIAPTQLHDKIFPANSKYEWTQCFGGASLDEARLFDKSYDAAVEYLDGEINALITKEQIEALDEKYTKIADTPVPESKIRHNGSGFGALEAMRMAKDCDGTVPPSMTFPASLIGKNEEPWKYLLDNGSIKETEPAEILSSFMTGEKWMPRLKEATEKAPTWNAYLHYGIAVYNYIRTDVLVAEAYSEEANEVQAAEAERAWLESVRLRPNVWAYRNLAVLETNRGNDEAAEAYYDKALALPEVFDDYAIASEYIMFLNKIGKFEKSFELYKSLPDACKAVDRIKISTSAAAVKLFDVEYFEKFFSEKHHAIREAENTLTDVWFEYCARKMAKERGIEDLTEEVLDKLIDEAWESCPPDYDIDFRMSTKRNSSYRLG